MTVGCFYEINLRSLAIHHDYPAHQDYDDIYDVNDCPLETFLQCIAKSSVRELYLHHFSDLGGSVQYLAGLHEIHFTNGRAGVLQSEDVLQLVTRCPDLTKLVIRNCFPVPDNFLLPLLDQCPALKSLTILSRPRFYYGMEYTAAGRKLKELVSGKYPQLKESHSDYKYFSGLE